jgi:hypothetical protein
VFASRAEVDAVAALYDRIDGIDFSRRVLALRAERLAVLAVAGLRWNDLGEPKRVVESLNMAGVRPGWAENEVQLVAAP